MRNAPAARSRLPQFLRPHELKALLAAARRSSPRDYALILAMSHAGLRVAEACGLRWGDIDDDTILVRRGKGDKQRLIPLHDRLKAALAQLPFLDESGDSPVFISRHGQALSTRRARQVVEGLCLEAGIERERAHPHVLRHTFATNALRKTGNLLVVQRLLGHASVSTTQIYTHLVLDDLRAAVELLD